MNKISWNGGEPKLDIRQWNSEHTRMSRGITMDSKEGLKLTGLLRDYYVSREDRHRASSRDDYER